MLGINNSINNSNYRNNSPKFGMALKLDPSATPIIKRQAVKLGEKSKNNFLSKIQQTFERQKDNPVDIIVRKTKHRNALAAEVVDSEMSLSAGENLKNQISSQPFAFKNGSLGFLSKAEKRANKLNETNNQINQLKEMIPEATLEDYRKPIKVKGQESLEMEV